MISETWARFGRAVLFAVILSASIVLLLLFFSKFVGVVSDGTLLVSVLGILVTALITWQIFNAVENSKTLSKMEKLDDDLRSKSLLITTLNSQVLDIIEAHNERNIAQGIDYWENKYIHAAKSLKLFLRGNVSSDYEPLNRLLLDMASIIERVNKEATEDEKIVFARSFIQLEKEHENIIDIIHKREDDLRGLRKQVVRLRDKRKRLFDEYVSKETSDEKSEREARELAAAARKGAKER